MHKIEISLLVEKYISDTDSVENILETPILIAAIETKFPAHEDSINRLYDMTVTEDQKLWIGGNNRELKLYDLQGHLHRTVTNTYNGYHICMYNEQLMFSDRNGQNGQKDI